MLAYCKLDNRKHSHKCERPQVGCSTKSRASPKSYREIVADYIAQYRVRARCEISGFLNLSESDAVRLAALGCKPCGHKHEHQYRIPQAALRKGWHALRKLDFHSFQTFDALYEQVLKDFKKIHGLGELATYDISCRIGARYRLTPSVIYLHRGTRAGAENLLGHRLKKTLDRSKVDHVSGSFRRLSVSELEDCLCIYKDEIKRVVKVVQ